MHVLAPSCNKMSYVWAEAPGAGAARGRRHRPSEGREWAILTCCGAAWCLNPRVGPYWDRLPASTSELSIWVIPATSARTGAAGRRYRRTPSPTRLQTPGPAATPRPRARLRSSPSLLPAPWHAFCLGGGPYVPTFPVPPGRASPAPSRKGDHREAAGPTLCRRLGVLPSDQPQLSDHYGVLADLRY
jgi:hypothetical protein